MDKTYVVLDTEGEGAKAYLGPFPSLDLAKRQITTGPADVPWLHSQGSEDRITDGKWVICRIVPEFITRRYVSKKHGEGVEWRRVGKRKGKP